MSEEQQFTDLELVDEYIEKSRSFVNPCLLRLVCGRGLYDVINFLPTDILEAKSIARARMAKRGKYFGDPEIDAIAGEIQRVNFLRKQLANLSITDVDKTIPVLVEMLQRSEHVRDYFKDVKIS